MNFQKKKHPNARRGWKDEKHVYFFIKKYGWVRANYCGEKTHYRERLKRGDRPINRIDGLAKIHDGNYAKADKFKGVKRAREIRSADLELLKGIKKERNYFFIRMLIIFALFLKIQLDNLGIPLRKGYIGKK